MCAIHEGKPMPNKEKKKQLFTELMTAIDLYDKEADEPPVVSVEGLADPDLREAVIAQSCRNDEAWVEKLCLGLTRQYMERLIKAQENDYDEDIEKDYICGLGVAIYMSWIQGQTFAVMKLLALMGVALDIDEAKKELGFLGKIFTPPPMAVAIKDAYLHLDSLNIIEKGSKGLTQKLALHASHLDLDDVKALMEKEGYDVDMVLPKLMGIESEDN